MINEGNFSFPHSGQSESAFEPSTLEALELEQQEKSQPHLKVSVMRHGVTGYLWDNERAAYNGHLTPEGIEGVETSAAKFAESIDPEKEVIVLWTSPMDRAVESADIVEKHLLGHGVTIVSRKIFDTFGVTKSREDYVGQFKTMGFPAFAKLWRKDTKEGTLPEGVEPITLYEEKTRRWLRRAQQVSNSVAPKDNKTLHIVIVGHETSVEEPLVKAFDLDQEINPQTLVNQAEFVDLDFTKGSDEFTIQRRGDEATLKMSFDPDKPEGSKTIIEKVESSARTEESL